MLYFSYSLISDHITIGNYVKEKVLNKDKNHYYYNIFLEKCSDELAKK